MRRTPVERWGPWAFVAGASEGLGAAFARRLAREGFDLVIAARRQGPLAALAGRLRRDHGVEVEPLALDLASHDLEARVGAIAREREIGLLVYDAAHSTQAPFLDVGAEDHLRGVDVNCRGPVVLCHVLGRPMAARGRGGIVIMGSLAGLQGSPMVASYAATKAFDLVLAESLWDEMGRRGVDVLACVAGATRTPGWERSLPAAARSRASAMLPEDVVDEALDALGRRPTVITGTGNRAAALVLQRILPRRAAIRVMGRATRALYGGRG